MKPDSVGLWAYELSVRLSNKFIAVSLLGETIPVSKVVTHWAKIVHSFNAASMNDTLHVFDLYYLDEAARVGLADIRPSSLEPSIHNDFHH